MGDFDKAIKYHTQHLVIAMEVGDLTGEGRAYGNLRIAYPWQRQCGASSAGSGWSSGGVGGRQVFRRLLDCAETEPRAANGKIITPGYGPADDAVNLEYYTLLLSVSTAGTIQIQPV